MAKTNQQQQAIKINDRVMLYVPNNNNMLHHSNRDYSTGIVGNVVEVAPYLVTVATDGGGKYYTGKHNVQKYAAPTMIVTVTGRQIVAKMVCNHEVLAVGIATCSKTDTFNPFVGMQIAVARLMDELQAPKVVAPQAMQQVADGEATLIDYLSYKDKK